jgi:hypothetical protein
VLANAEFDIAGIGKAFQTNMLSTFEAARVSQLLRSPHAHSFVAGAARFVAGDVQAGLDQMARAVEPFGRASWPIVTYLPFFADVSKAREDRRFCRARGPSIRPPLFGRPNI